VLILFIGNGLITHAADDFNLNLTPKKNKSISYSAMDSDWINVTSNFQKPSFTLKTNNDITFGDEIAFAWNLSDSLSLNLSVFENQTNNLLESQNESLINQQKSYSKLITPKPSLEVNKNLSGYKFGISSKLDMGKSYVVNINLDYGQLEEANLAGFYNSKVNTSSFELGIRKSKFGASLLTDSYLENNTDILDNTRIGFEFDWYFSDNTIISFGSKQRYNSKSSIKQSNSLDNLTGNVQYIKFQRNL
jgi:hypothetical protein